MKFAFLVIFLIFICGRSAEEIQKNSNVFAFEELDVLSWEKNLSEIENIIVLTATHDNYIHIYDAVVDVLEVLLDPKSNTDPEVLAITCFKLNCTKNSEFCTNNKIFPAAITWFYKGNVWSKVAITPQWNSDSLTYWVNANLLRDVRDISEAFEITTSCPMKHDFFVVLFDESAEENLLHTFLKLQLELKTPSSAFYKVTDSEIIKKEGGDKKTPFFKVYQCNRPEEPSFFINIDESPDTISNFIASKAFAKVSKISNPVLKNAFENFDVTLIVGVPKKNYDPKELFAWLAKVENAAVLWDYSDLMVGFSHAGCSGTVWPTAVAVIEHGTKPLAFNENLVFNLENVQKWVDSIHDGTYVPFKKSKKIDPIENEHKPLKDLSYDDWEVKVEQSLDPVVIIFTASRQACNGGYCFTAANVLEKVAEYFEHTFPDFPITFYTYDTELNYPVRPELPLPSIVIFDKDTEVEYPSPLRAKFFQVKEWLNEFFSLKEPHEEL